jgi:MFS family permease
MGMFGVSVILGPALGPTIGGLLIDQFNWRYVFFVNVPLAGSAMLLGTLFMPEREEGAKRPSFDYVGFVLLAVALATLLSGLSNGQREVGRLHRRQPPPPPFGSAFQELTVKRRVELRLALSVAAAMVAFIFGWGLPGSVYLVPPVVQTIRRYTPLDAGLLLARGSHHGAVLLIAGTSDRVPARSLIIANFVYCPSSY